MMYSESEWSASAGHLPLREHPLEDLMLLHRHWLWAHQMREAFDSSPADLDAIKEAGQAMLATREMGFMFVWYALLWVVIEACIDPKEGRQVDIRGRFRADIDMVADTLKRFRHAVFHVPRKGEYVDKRLLALVAQPGSAQALRRIHIGFGRMLHEELQRRNPE